jgi:Asp/Glu/hydantoin racemase
MKLWYQSMSRQMWGAYNRVLRDLLDGARDADTQIELHGVRASGNALRDIDRLERSTVVENARRAEQLGFEAFLIGSIADAGLAEARAVVDIPVLGLGETTLHVAALIADKFGLIAINESHAARLVDNATRYGFAGRLAAVEHLRLVRARDLQLGFDDVEARRRLLARFQDAAGAAATAGAEAIIAASGTMMALLAYGGIADTLDGTPIVDGTSDLVKLAEMAVKVNRILGGRFTADRIPVAVELLRSYDAIPSGGVESVPAASIEPGGSIARFRAS